MTYLFLMLGYPGSGKSYVATWLAPTFQAVHIRSDDLRLRMFGQDRLEIHTLQRYRLPLIGAAEYMEEQVLKAGHSVVNDANFNRRALRRAHAKMAAACDALAVTVWIKTPLDVARQRVVVRTIEGKYPAFEDDLVERMAKNIEPPGDQELVIVLNGTASIDDQRRDFGQQLADITARKVQ